MACYGTVMKYKLTEVPGRGQRDVRLGPSPVKVVPPPLAAPLSD
jgi:hypothetical protein